MEEKSKSKNEFIFGNWSDEIQSLFIQATKNCPVFNTYEITKEYGGKDGMTLEKDRNHVRALEFISFKGTNFEVVEGYTDEGKIVYEVKTNIYPTKTNLYIHSYFAPRGYVEKISYTYPTKEKIIKKLKKAIGLPYLWGGNIFSKSKFIDLYPPKYPKKLSKEDLNIWELKGMDCSGLLFWATKAMGKDGYARATVPRNTGDLIKDNFGKIVKIEGKKDIKDIVELLKPLDLILYTGHVIIVLDKRYCIESRELKGVVTTLLRDRLGEILKKSKPADKIGKNRFIVKRWYLKEFMEKEGFFGKTIC